MKSTKLLAVVAVAAVGVGGAGTAVAAKTKRPPAQVKITTKDIRSPENNPKFVINRGTLSDHGLGFGRDTYRVRSGGTIKFQNNSGASEGHTFTFVKSFRELPRTDAKINRCFNDTFKLCATMFKAHKVDPKTFAIGQRIVRRGKRGVDTGATSNKAGDSIYQGQGAKPDVLKVSAARGKTLYLLCLVHPWMQAKVLVK